MLSIKSPGFIKLYILIAFLLSIFACESENGTDSSTEAANETAQMIQLVKEATGKIDPQKAVYIFNKERAEYFRNLLPNAKTLEDSIQISVLRAYELLSVGLNETAIKELEELLFKAEEKTFSKPGIKFDILRVLGLNCYKLAELNYFSENPDTQSDTLQNQQDEVNKRASAARRAIQIFEEILNERPDDYESKWMLNRTYKILGEYSDGVPVKWRLQENEFSTEGNLPRFEEVAAQRGLDVKGHAGGAIADDFNNDGHVDIIISSGNIDNQIKYFENDGKGNFVDKTEECGLQGISGGLHLAHADYDNNGYLDFMILRGAWLGKKGEIPNSLIRNNGNGTFSDVTISAGLLSYHPTQTAVWTDFNLDGWVDLFIGNESDLGQKNRPCELYISQGIDSISGKVTFKNMIKESGLDEIRGMIKGVSSTDSNNDMKFDLYISMMDDSNVFLLNKGFNSEGGIVFEHISEQTETNEPVNSFSCWFWDFNNDGWEDIYVASSPLNGEKSFVDQEGKYHFDESSRSRSVLYKNPADWKFPRVDSIMELNNQLSTMGSNYGDINNDGFDDAYFDSGASYSASSIANKLFLNDKGERFRDITTTQFGHLGQGNGVAFADFDLDGDLDIYAVHGGNSDGNNLSNSLFINELDNDYAYLSIKLEGTVSNRAAIGTRLRLKYLDKEGKIHQVTKKVSPGSSFGGNCLTVHFGLAEAVEIFDLKILWPTSTWKLEEFKGIQLNQGIKIVEGTNTFETLK